jgi:toxin secretion/phage lysis holin
MLKKEGVGIVVALAGGVVGHLFGGWDLMIKTLMFFMLLDMFLGVTAAAVFHKSKKGDAVKGLSSSIGIKGFARKIVILSLVAMAYRMDLLLEINYIRTAAVFGFAFFEGVSILELAKLMEIPLPEVLYSAIDLLGGKSKIELTDREKEGESQ